MCFPISNMLIKIYITPLAQLSCEEKAIRRSKRLFHSSPNFSRQHVVHLLRDFRIVLPHGLYLCLCFLVGRGSIRRRGCSLLGQPMLRMPKAPDLTPNVSRLGLEKLLPGNCCQSVSIILGEVDKEPEQDNRFLFLAS